jgi:hypothetical protein
MPLAESNPIPTVLAFLVCETVIHDAETQKKTIVGVFDRVLAATVPQSLNVALYAKMVEGNGQYTFKIRMVNLKDETPVVQVPITGNWANPQGPFELGVNFRGLVIPQFGTYEFQIYANDVYLGRAVFTLENMPFPAAAAKSG